MSTKHFVIDRTPSGREHTVDVHYDGDLSGSVCIVTTNKYGEAKAVHVPGWVLADFIAERVAAERIVRLEKSPNEVLCMPDGWPGGRWGER